jgi:hypothetical protein
MYYYYPKGGWSDLATIIHASNKSHAIEKASEYLKNNPIEVYEFVHLVRADKPIEIIKEWDGGSD